MEYIIQIEIVSIYPSDVNHIKDIQCCSNNGPVGLLAIAKPTGLGTAFNVY